MATLIQQQQFVSTYYPDALAASQQTGISPSIILAQAAQETGWGTSSAALNQNNFFGISPGGNLATYNSPQEGFNAYANLLNTPNYSSKLSGVNLSDPGGVVGALVAGQYNTADPNYTGAVTQITGTVQQILGNLGLPDGNNGGNPFATSSGGIGTTEATPGLSTPTNAPGTSDPVQPNSGGVLGWLQTHVLSFIVVIVGMILVGGSLFLFGTDALKPPSLSKKVI